MKYEHKILETFSKPAPNVGELLAWVIVSLNRKSKILAIPTGFEQHENREMLAALKMGDWGGGGVCIWDMVKKKRKDHVWTPVEAGRNKFNSTITNICCLKNCMQ